MPRIAQAAPTGAKSNIAYGSPKDFSRNIEMIILGGVPIKVIIPPRIEANDKGIKVIAGLRFSLSAA